MSQMKISIPVLATIVTTCLAVGSGGAWVAGRTVDPAPQTVQAPDQKTGERIAALEAAQHERDKALDQRLESIETQLSALNSRLDRVLARRQ